MIRNLTSFLKGMTFLITMSFPAKGLAEPADSLFSIEEYISLVIANHPVIKQAGLLSDLARQEIRLARGFFDPKISTDFERKNFDEKNYYSLWDSKLKIPVWFNTDLKLGYEKNTGDYVSNEHITGSAGLWYAGVSVPVGQGLFIDSRRATLKQALLLQDLNEAERVKEVNKVLLQALKDYLDWYFAYRNFLMLDEGLTLANYRFEAIKTNVVLGDEAPLDSVEAKIIVQTRKIDREQALVNYRNAGLIASNNIWNEEGIPYEIRENMFPVINPAWFEEIKKQDPENLKIRAKQNHPELIKYQVKLQDLNIQRSLYREMIKPKLNLEYNFLWDADAVQAGDAFRGMFENDYKYGLSFEMPVWIRKERAKLQISNLKISQTDLEYSQKEREILNSIEATYNLLQNYSELIVMQENMVQNYEKLLSGELLNFTNGESSVFLVNTRESKLIESRIKMMELYVKYYKSVVELIWAAGIPNLDLSGPGED